MSGNTDERPGQVFAKLANLQVNTIEWTSIVYCRMLIIQIMLNIIHLVKIVNINP